MIKEWLGIPTVHTHEWTTDISIEEWWSKITCRATPNHKAIASLTMLVSWMTWKERKLPEGHPQQIQPANGASGDY
jgi:hypothetical protein